MPRIAVDVDALVEDLLTDFCFTAGRGERAATFFSASCVETKSEKTEQISDCLWLENHWIDAGIEHTWIASLECFPDRFVCDTRGVEFCNVEVVAKEVTGTGSVGCSGCGRQTHETRLLVDEVAVLCGGGAGRAACLVEARADHFCFFARGDHVVDGPRASSDGDV